ncbi:MAG: CHAT domain-containing protein, partial [Anaerolineae bacterium]
MDYNDFLVYISTATEPGHFVITTKSATAGEASSVFALPFSETELENFVLKIGLTRRGVRKIHSPEWRAAQSFGQKLYLTLFADDIRATYLASRNDAMREGKGLRIKIILDTPELASYPWEFLYDPSVSRFLSLYEATPLVRYVELSTPPPVLRIAPPLRVLVVASSPSDYPPLDLEREKSNLDSALVGLVQQNQITVDWLPNASFENLRSQLLKRTYHIFHFIGHGGFDEVAQDGLLLFEDEFKRGRRISGERLAVLLGNHHSLRLAILNSCEGARTSVQDPFAGTAMTLGKSGGLAAVVAMQFEITDTASIAFSRGFYSALAAGKPVDAAVVQARLAIFSEDNDVEWGTPVLYLRAPDGVIFVPLSSEEIAESERKRAEQARYERERKKTEQLAHEKAEAERVAQERAEQERLVQEREEQEQLAREKAEVERLEQEKIRRERAARVDQAYRLAQQSFSLKQYAETIKTLEGLLTLDATNAAARGLLSEAQAEREKEEQRAKEKAGRERAAHIAGLLKTGRENLERKQYSAALTQAQQILALDPNNIVALELQSKAHLKIQEQSARIDQVKAPVPVELPRKGFSKLTVKLVVGGGLLVCIVSVLFAFSIVVRNLITSGPPAITAAVLSKDTSGDTKAPVDVTTAFPADQAVFHAVVTIANMPTGTKVKVVWTAVDV